MLLAALVYMASHVTILAWDEYMLEATLLAVSMVLGFLFELWRSRRESTAEQVRSERERALEDERHSRMRAELDEMRAQVADLLVFRALAEHRLGVLEEGGEGVE
jgi:steroid 5-alpha reductase family enzyme